MQFELTNNHVHNLADLQPGMVYFSRGSGIQCTTIVSYLDKKITTTAITAIDVDNFDDSVLKKQDTEISKLKEDPTVEYVIIQTTISSEKENNIYYACRPQRLTGGLSR